MQDRYAGDVGDFLKLLTLRALISSKDVSPGLSLGVVWYRTTTEESNADGKHIAYLTRTTTRDRMLCELDDELAGCLLPVAHADPRSVADLQRCGALPSNTLYHEEALTWEGLRPFERSARLKRRADWLTDALTRTAGADLVFLDPDNGIRPSAHRQPRTRRSAVKHAYLDEVARFVERGQSVVVYHHAGRIGSVEEQVEMLTDLIESEIGVRPTCAIRASRGTVRLFVVVAQPHHQAVLRHRAASLDGLGGPQTLRVYF